MMSRGSVIESAEIIHIILKALDIVALAVGMTAPAQIEGIGSQATPCKLFSAPSIHAAVRIEAVTDRRNCAWRAGRAPDTHKEIAGEP